MFGMYMYFYTLYVHVYIIFYSDILSHFSPFPLPIIYTYIKCMHLLLYIIYQSSVTLMTLSFHYLLLSNYYAMHNCARPAWCGVSWHLVNTPQVHTQSCCVLNTLSLALHNDN